jgi:hypothetical protein
MGHRCPREVLSYLLVVLHLTPDVFNLNILNPEPVTVNPELET